MTDGDRLPIMSIRNVSRRVLYREPRHLRHLGHRRSPAAAWPRKSAHRCDHCGSQFGDMGPWDWPPDCPTRQIRLHPRCEQPWWDCGGQLGPEGDSLDDLAPPFGGNDV